MRLICLLVWVAGCSGGPSGGDMGVDAGGPKVCTPDGQNVNLNGLYAVQAKLSVNVKVVPGCSGNTCIVDTDADAKLLLLTQVTQTGTSLTVGATPCKIVVPPVALKGGNKPIVLTVPDSLVASVGTVSAPGMLDGTQTCANIT